MKINLHSKSVQGFWQILKYLSVCILIVLLCVYFRIQPFSPKGDVIPWESLGNRSSRSASQIDARTNDIKVSIGLNKEKFDVGENVDIVISIRNAIGKDVIIRKPDSMAIMGNEVANIHGLKFLVTSSDTGIILDRGGLMTSVFIEEAFPFPEDFIALHPYGKYTSYFEILNIFPDIVSGNYTIQAIYTNYYFGAAVTNKIKSEFMDYDAWIGTTASNVESFRIVP